jgi:glutathione S-transferase
MITLYTFGPAFGLPDPSPFVTKVEMLLKMTGLAYRTDTTGFRQAPKGKLPYIDDDGEQVADSTFIRWHLENKYRIDFDKGLSADQRAVAWAFEKILTPSLSPRSEKSEESCTPPSSP